MHIKSTSKTIDDIYDMSDRGRISLNPYYQRNSVWDNARKVFLIDSILFGELPLPKFFVEVKHDDEDKRYFDVVDGQQRITTILEFMSDKFSLDVRDFEGFYMPKKYNGYTFAELPADLRRKFKDVALNFEEINDAREEEVLGIFIRLNTGIKPLSPQDIRNARHHRNFKKLVRSVSGEYGQPTEAINYFLDSRIISEQKYKEAVGDELVSVLLETLIKSEVAHYKAKNIDSIWKSRDSSLSEEDLVRIESKFAKVFNLFSEVIPKESVNHFGKGFTPKTKSTLVILFHFIDRLFLNNKIIDRNRLDELEDALIILSSKVNIDSEGIYKDLFVYTRSSHYTKSNMDKAISILMNELSEFIIDLDSNRLFSKEDKIKLWEKSRECGICGEEITSLSDAQVDHIVPWSKGGKTDLSNAQLSHEKCNKSKGNRL
jgi:hypothetical protein